MQSEILSSLQKQMYQQDGFLVLEKFIEKEICETLIKRAGQLIDAYDASNLKTFFSSKDQQHAKTLYFLDSGDQIHFFFEEGALDATGKLNHCKSLSINKIGHALHDLDPIFYDFSRSHKLATLVNELSMPDALLVQSMYLCKQPFIGGEVIPHQDSTYLFTDGEPVMGLWFALEDASIDNGCLWAIPGGHKEKLKSRFKRNENNQTEIEIYDNTPWPLEKMRPLEVPQGTLIVLHGLLPHMSKENRSSHSRHAYALHVISGNAQFSADNWLKRPHERPFRGFI